MAVYKDKKRNTYFVRFRVNGREIKKRGFASKLEAQQYEFQKKFAEDNPTRIRFHELIDAYREYTKENIQYATYMRVGIFFEKFIKPNFPNKYIEDITELDCLKFWQLIQKLEKSSGYKNDILGAFKGVFKHAEIYYRLKNNPTIHLQRFPKTREEKLKRKNRDMNIWTHEEFEKFIRCVEGEAYQAIFMTLFYTGMRKGEALALTWNDLKDHKISIDKSLSRKTDLDSSYEVKEPKTVSSIRDIKLNESLYQYLLSYKNKRMNMAGFSEDWYMFGTEVPLAENTLTRVKDRAIDKAGVKRIHIHDFRHSHASILISNGVNIVAVSKRLGHTDVSMTLSIYTHLLEKNDDELIDNIEADFIKLGHDVPTEK